MSVMTQDVRAILGKLVETCHDGEFGFDAVARAAEGIDPLLRSELLQYSRQRREFATDLNSALADMGEEPVTHGTASGMVHRGWIDLRNGLGVVSRPSILAECERAEKAAVATYRQAAIEELPASISDLVTMQLEAIQRIFDRIRLLHEAARAK
jgi:uncharacterized protein (TIGR02284 family)